MSFDENRRREIILYMLEMVSADRSDIIRHITEQFGISTTSVKRYLAKCVDDRILQEEKTAECGYRLCSEITKYECTLQDDTPEEDQIYFDRISPLLTMLPDTVQDIWAYTCMEILNNAIEHSGGSKLSVTIKQNYLYTEVVITDDGIGAFENVRRYMQRELSREICFEDAVMELYKGKLTTAAANHSGEGIFFSSRMMDQFLLSANGTVYIQYADRERLLNNRLLAYYQKLNHIGTMVSMRLSNFSTRDSRDVFNLYADAEKGFVKTSIPVSDACRTTKVIARSQARRLVRRLEEFEEAVLDFSEVDFCGQGFADEVFRVFHNAHPETKLTVIHANQDVERMIRHVGFR
ncbi:MAG: DUF4325 domain-containing protein [bacterium]|nr:DUF4325 domain-containing protein [bacterium]